MSNRRNFIVTVVAIVLAAFSGAFIPSRIEEVGIRSTRSQPSPSYHRKGVILNGWLKDTLNSLGFDFEAEKLKFQGIFPKFSNDSDPKSKQGKVIRTAVKGYDKEASTPASKLYTTKKESRSDIILKSEGVEGDYNHYRTTALSSTPDRAVSILTTDIVKMLKEAGWPKVGEGDLGENIYVDGIEYTFFEIGKRYKFSSSVSGNEKKIQQDDVIVEITERIEPCGNLCRLNYINDESLPPQERFENCKKFLLWLDEKDGLRGWYAKIIEGGRVKIGDSVSLVTAAAAV